MRSGRPIFSAHQRVFFVGQDNWALPALETAVADALHFAPRVEKALVA